MLRQTMEADANGLQGVERPIYAGYIRCACASGRHRGTIMARKLAKFLRSIGCTVMIHFASLYRGAEYDPAQHRRGMDDRGPCGCHIALELCRHSQWMTASMMQTWKEEAKYYGRKADERFDELLEGWLMRNSHRLDDPGRVPRVNVRGEPLSSSSAGPFALPRPHGEMASEQRSGCHTSRELPGPTIDPAETAQRLPPVPARPPLRSAVPIKAAPVAKPWEGRRPLIRELHA